MSNMSYCRFQNTANDLADCMENLGEELSKEEDKARRKIVTMARQIVEDADCGYIPNVEPKQEDS